ncbi:Transcription regulator LuxR, C-terminal [uncultured Caudovirales phage]|uniref:Transcription regulator LuxR, C-terminal n=1 Tax=uncultured Caudovirales phage TaxID=2100421 RepID=A0A6J5NPT1_9CAUD|nr:Transcription regulator LuxR, C-terminal [uncultured Caudovirales phage]
MDTTKEAVLLSRIAGLEAQVASLTRALLDGASGPKAGSLADALAGMTIKQRATLIAMLEGHSFSAIAQATGVDDTTIKLHAKACYERLGVPGKARLMEKAGELLSELAAGDLWRSFGVPLGWMESQPPSLMVQLQRTKVVGPTGGKGRS